MKKIKMILFSALMMIGLVPALSAAEKAELSKLEVKVGESTTATELTATEKVYSLSVENDVTKITLVGTVNKSDTAGNDATAALSVKDQSGLELTLAQDTKTFTFTLVAKDSDDTNSERTTEYTLNVTRKEAATTPGTGDTEEMTKEEVTALTNEVKDLIAADDDLKGKVETVVYDNEVEFYYTERTLEDGTKFKKYTSVLLEKGDVAADVFAVIKEDLLSEENSVFVELPESNVLTKAAMDVLKTMKDVFFGSSNNSEAYWEIDLSKLTDEDSDVKLNVYVGESVNEQLRKTVESLLVDKNKGLVVDFEHNGKLPEGTKVTVAVDGKFKDGDVVSLFYYNPTTKRLEEKVKNLKVEYGYVEFELDHCSTYVLAASTNNAATGTTNVLLYSGILVSALALITVLLKKKAN